MFEVIKEAHSAYEKTYEKAKSGSTCKGHEGRKTKKRLSLPLSEKQNALDAAAQLNISIKEFLRLAVIWLADGIKEETITSLTKSRRIGKDTIAYQWSRENRNKPASESVKNLKEAQKDARELQEYIDSLEEEEFSTELPFVIQSELVQEELVRSAEQNHFETELLRQHEMASDVEFLARCKMREFDIDFETAKEWVEDNLNEFDMLSKMTSKEKKEFLQKENHQHKQLEREATARADKKFQEAREQHIKKNPASFDSDLLEQHSKDMEASRIISAEESKKDMKDYKNEPLLWDEESDRTFHRMMNQTKDADG